MSVPLNYTQPGDFISAISLPKLTNCQTNWCSLAQDR